MSPTPKVQSGSPRRQRLKKNRNAEAGMRNRENGLFKKTNTWHHYYGGDILIFIKRPDGRIKGYESRPKLLQEFSKLPIPAHEIRGPDDIDTVTERADTPSTTAQGEKISRIEPSIIWTNLPTLIAAIATTIAIAKKTPKSLIMSVQANF
ncbi:hypothetical protein FoTM2_004359 [Fusarium oxysporum f. sp. vasinfectum]|uniref:MADS-box domain-containing protein n=1 Tax=Fusarium oxysporum f. sp. vasinfectum 25433 TaxID=1089449 RepID=X0MQ71_FUSOX|nr:hypothetical protein FOTG_00055 [Fusarium oxysporum f. sp. vasinfectum 25433]KAK2936413.1 hypothetical protein FoTM2_004359 [Fusarium oxysporum f. sp. vasinfectum]